MSPFPHCSGRAVLNSPKHVPNWQLPSAPVPHRTHMFLRNGPHVCVSQVNVDVPNSPHLLPPESCRVVCRALPRQRGRGGGCRSRFSVSLRRVRVRANAVRGSRRPYSVDESSNKSGIKFDKIKFHHSRDTFEEKTNLAYIVHGSRSKYLTKRVGIPSSIA